MNLSKISFLLATTHCDHEYLLCIYINLVVNHTVCITEYSALSRLGLADPQTFIRKHFANENLMLLRSCAVGKQLLDQVEGSVEEAISSDSWIDVMVCATRFY